MPGTFNAHFSGDYPKLALPPSLKKGGHVVKLQNICSSSQEQGNWSWAILGEQRYVVKVESKTQCEKAKPLKG